MKHETSFQEMIERYNRELVSMQKKSAPAPRTEQPACPAPEPRQERNVSQSEQIDEAPPCAQNLETDHSLTVGDRGPVLLQDEILHERLEGFVNAKLLERPVHVKGYGAFGSFRAYQSMKPYTSAGFLQDANRKTPVFVRFSQAGGRRGSPDTARDVRGFATKFYTKEGIFDLVGNHLPVFFIRDAIRFPETIAALSPSPVTNLPDPAMFWDFIARTPEALHMLTWLYSDLGTMASYRTMRGFGVNTYVWKNDQGVRRFVKYHWLPMAGERCITKEQAVKLAGENPDIAGEDLHNALARGEKVEYELCVQLMNPPDGEKLPYDPLDDTKVWSERQFPLMPVGRLTLDRNPEDYHTQVEQAAFSPSNLVEGIELSDDKMLQGRSFIYADSQRRRLGPDFRQIPVNHMKGWSPVSAVTSGSGVFVSGVQMRSEIDRTDNYTQAGERYRSLNNTEQAHLVDNIASELYQMPERIQRCVLGYLFQASPEFSDRVMSQMEMYSTK